MNKERSRREHKKQQGRGFLKKIKGKWAAVIVAGGVLVGGGAVYANEGAMAQVNTAVVSVMSRVNSSQFNNKTTYLNNEAIQRESSQSMNRITGRWGANSVEQVRAEIERQRAAGLDVYVIQWGDTLSVLAQATGKTVDQIAAENNLGNIHLIFTGDILTGILKDAPASQGQGSKQNISDLGLKPQEKTAEQSKKPANQSNKQQTAQSAKDKQASVETKPDSKPTAETPAQPTETEQPAPVLPTPSIPTPSDIVEQLTEPEVKTYQVTEDVKHGVEYKEDPSLQPGEKKVVQEGKDGKRVSYYTITTYPDGREEKSESVVSEEESVAAVTQIVHIGPAIVETPEVEEESTPETESSPSETETEQTEDSKTITEKVTETEVIEFETVLEETTDLPAGEQQVVQEGQHGERTRTYEVVKENDQEVSRNLISEEVTKEAVNKIVKVGVVTPAQPEQPAQPETSTEEPEVEASPGPQVLDKETEEKEADEQTGITVEKEKVTITIPFETKEVANDELEQGKQVIAQEGQVGEKVVTTTIQKQNGEVVSSEVTDETVTKEPVTQIIHIGTKVPEPEDVVEVKPETEAEAVPYGREERRTDKLNKGETKVVQQGVEGVKTITYEVTYTNGQETSRKKVSEGITQQPVNEITEIGTKEPQPEKPKPEKEVPKPAGKKTSVQYRVERGDTLYKVAQKFGVSMDSIVKVNRQLRSKNTPLSSEWVLTIPNAPLKPMDIPESYDNKRVVMIDPGHGGSDSGAVANGTTEKAVNLIMSKKLRDELKRRGYEVRMMRENDKDISLVDRGRITNNSDADIFISVHQNAHPRHNAQGIETFYYKSHPNWQPKINKKYHSNGQRIANSKHLSDLIQRNLLRETGAVDRKVQSKTFAVLRETARPAVLVEAGFLDHPVEGKRIQRPEYHDKVVKAVADAVDEYFRDVHGK
ncbi:G5 domain-containing protein [Dolosigranulum pigrum]|uniref:G5 domain-containing protein n=1 Tax=Dolosigranulum pigrum TaxID=29394 RepID=UPI001AD895FC|nr:G5 domain-containing protein [Dolosigranulum pigrum]QTJ36211.1 LysM peptidoglycan-binding domain-containing protein [Dolosigranulum pigrum]